MTVCYIRHEIGLNINFVDKRTVPSASFDAERQFIWFAAKFHNRRQSTMPTKTQTD